MAVERLTRRHMPWSFTDETSLINHHVNGTYMSDLELILQRSYIAINSRLKNIIKYNEPPELCRKYGISMKDAKRLKNIKDEPSTVVKEINEIRRQIKEIDNRLEKLTKLVEKQQMIEMHNQINELNNKLEKLIILI
jgi:predicted  nucleic acid-binding Zn-ribbon protein